jgi:hypothetical protein
VDCTVHLGCQTGGGGQGAFWPRWQQQQQQQRHSKKGECLEERGGGDNCSFLNWPAKLVRRSGQGGSSSREA